MCHELAKSIVFILGVNQFCAVFYFLILTMDFSSQGCSVTQSSSMADQAPRRKLSTSLAVTCIESKFNRHAIQALHTFKQLTLYLTTTVVMSPHLHLVQMFSLRKRWKGKILDPTFYATSLNSLHIWCRIPPRRGLCPHAGRCHLQYLCLPPSPSSSAWHNRGRSRWIPGKAR